MEEREAFERQRQQGRLLDRFKVRTNLFTRRAVDADSRQTYAANRGLLKMADFEAIISGGV